MSGSIKQVWAFSGGPAGFRELREAYRNHFRVSWYLIVPGITSYDMCVYIYIYNYFCIHTYEGRLQVVGSSPPWFWPSPWRPKTMKIL